MFVHRLAVTTRFVLGSGFRVAAATPRTSDSASDAHNEHPSSTVFFCSVRSCRWRGAAYPLRKRKRAMVPKLVKMPLRAACTWPVKYPLTGRHAFLAQNLTKPTKMILVCSLEDLSSTDVSAVL